MSIRNKILLYFSVVTIVLVGAALFFIYTLFDRYRQEDFQQRQKDKIETTLKFLTQIKTIDQDLLEAMDRITIHDLYDEKLLIFDKNKTLVYSSIDDTPVSVSVNILNALSAEKPWIEHQEDKYDVVGVYMEREEKAYYGISKAYDVSGYSKQEYLEYVLSLTFLAISLVVILTSYFLSKRITYSISDVTRQIREFAFDGKNNPMVTTDAKDEIAILVQRFNELMHRMNEAFAFQKHAVHHISHELKTPIAVLVSDFEKLEREPDPDRIRELLKIQKENTKSLSEIINSLLELAKAESGNNPVADLIRIDELIYDLVAEISVLHAEFHFSVEYAQNVVNESSLTVVANSRLLKAAISNLMINCIQYSVDNRAMVVIDSQETSSQVDFVNHGPILDEQEQQFLFQHFFRGKNSTGKRGFGLGLVFVHKILTLYGGQIAYSNNGVDSNTFTVKFPLN